MKKCASLLAVLATLPAIAQDRRDWASLDKQAEQSYAEGDLKEAIRIAKLAIDNAPDSKHSGHSLDRLGFFEYTSGDLKNGESHLRQALEIRKAAGADPADYAESANDLALFCRDSGKFPEGRRLAEEALAIRTQALGAKDLRFAESLNTLGSILALMGDYDLAIARFEQAVAIHESQGDPKDFKEEYGTLCINLAGTYQRVGKYGKAEATFQKGLDVLRIKPGVNHPAFAASLVGYAYLQADLGHYSTAEKLYDESGRLLREQLGDQHPAYTAFLNNRAALYTALGNFSVAESDYRKSLELKRKIYGPGALTVGASLRNLARLVYVKNPLEGEKLFQEAVDLYARNPQPPPFDYASALLGLGGAQRERGDLAAARVTIERATDVISKGLSVKHPMYAAALSDLALVHSTAREFPEAENRLQEAVAIVKETRGEDHPDLAQFLERLASVYEAAGDLRAAEPLYRRSAEIADRALTDMLSVGSERNKSALITNLEDPIPALIAFSEKAGAQIPDARVLAFETVARRKGRVLDQVHDWSQSLREMADPRIERRFEQWKAMLQCESSLAVAMGYRDLKPAVVGTCSLSGSELEGRYERLLHDLRTNWTAPLNRQAMQAQAVLKQRIDALETSLSREVPRFGPESRLIRMEDIRAKLPSGEILAEIVEFTAAHVKRYGAFLLDRSGNLQWIDLGPAAPIDLAVADLITAANDWSVSLSRNEKGAAESSEQTARDALQAISEKLRPMIDPIARRDGIHRLRIAPDGMLNLVPFAALSDARGRVLIERFAVTYVPTSRDLAELPPPPARGPIVIALSPGGGEHLAGGPFRAEKLERLAGAELEARDLQRRMPKAVLLGEGQATEARIKQLHRPALLHIIGHGIVRGNQNPDAAASAMTLSAIVLEEAYGRGAGSSQDGMLTALELETLDLEGTEMLVLSQCRMADGVPSTGEGVFGMRRAASIAGVKTFVAPLWNIADSTERALMSRFYEELSTGTDRAEALRRAQLELLHTSKSASFLQWAPLILSGDSAPLPHVFFAR